MLRNVVRLTHTSGRCSFGTYGMICSIPSQVVVWDFFHQQYVLNILRIWTWTPGPKRDVWFQCFVCLVKHKICFQNIRISKNVETWKSNLFFATKTMWLLVLVLSFCFTNWNGLTFQIIGWCWSDILGLAWRMIQQCQDEYVGGTFGPAFKGGEVAS